MLLGSNNSLASSVDTSLSASLNNNQQIINNIKLNAETGNANVASNTSAGEATSGEAATNLTVLNLTGREVDATNSLLVFVNVMGTWVGMIVDAPGATAAMLGNGVIENKTTINGDLDVDENATITNNITLSSKSGDADVTENTRAGDAKTGNALASANIANISTSKFKLSDWFGVLFINVYGKWVGSFGIDTEAGNRVVALGGDATPPAQGTALAAPSVRLGFVPRSGSTPPAATLSAYSAPQQESGDSTGVTPAEAELLKAYVQQTADDKPQVMGAAVVAKKALDMTNATMMAIGAVVVLAGAATAMSGSGNRFFGRRNRG